MEDLQWDSDDSKDTRSYFYDIAKCSGKVEHILPQFAQSPLMKAWKHPVKSRLLSHSEIDSVLDLDVVDWHDFHLEHILSIAR